MTETAIEIHDLRKRYGAKEVVSGLSLTIEQGETFALLGPNGAGKSTTVEILEGYRKRTSGSVSVLGEDPEHAGRSWRARLGMVLQDLPEGEVYGPYTVTEQLAQQASLFPNSRDVSELIAAVGLEHKAKARINTLSGGQRRRLDVALGIVGRPELLFLDEPTTGFDPEARREFWDLISSLSNHGTTILLTTHYLDEAAYLADRVGVILDGKLVTCAPVHELGGPNAQHPVVSWRDNRGQDHSKTTPEPGRLVNQLTARFGDGLDFEVRKPSLEEIYLQLLQDQSRESELKAAA